LAIVFQGAVLSGAIFNLSIRFQAAHSNTSAMSDLKSLPLIISAIISRIACCYIVLRIAALRSFMHTSCIITPIGVGLVSSLYFR
jgi:hypothetical protein